MSNDSIVILGLVGLAVLLWAYRVRRRDARLTAPFAARLGPLGIKVRAVGFGCDYCRGQQVLLTQTTRLEPKPGGVDLELTHDVILGEFCTRCGAEELTAYEKSRGRPPRNLFQLMDQLDPPKAPDAG